MSMDLYSVAGVVAMALVASMVSLRLIRDESSLRKKRILADKYQFVTANFAQWQNFVDRKYRLYYRKVRLMQVFEIHKYIGDSFVYIVARTNKHSEDYVRGDVEKMNNMLTPEMKGEGIRYVFALGTIESINKRTGERTRKKDKQSEAINLFS